MTILQSCPFCGGAPESRYFGDDDGGYWAVECYHNGAAFTTFCGVHGDDQVSAETAWNKRTLAKVGCQFRFKTGDQADWSDWNDGATPEWIVRMQYERQERALYAAEVPDGPA